MNTNPGRSRTSRPFAKRGRCLNPACACKVWGERRVRHCHCGARVGYGNR